MAMPGPLGRTKKRQGASAAGMRPGARGKVRAKTMTVAERRAQLAKSGQASKIASGTGYRPPSSRTRASEIGKATRESVARANLDPTRGGARPQAGKSVSAGRTARSAMTAQQILDRGAEKNRKARAAGKNPFRQRTRSAAALRRVTN